MIQEILFAKVIEIFEKNIKDKQELKIKSKNLSKLRKLKKKVEKNNFYEKWDFSIVAKKQSLKKIFKNRSESYYDFYAFKRTQPYSEKITVDIIEENLYIFFCGVLTTSLNLQKEEIFTKKLLGMLGNRNLVINTTVEDYKKIKEHLLNIKFESKAFREDIINQLKNLIFDELKDKYIFNNFSDLILEMEKDYDSIDKILGCLFIILIKKINLPITIFSHDQKNHEKPLRKIIYDFYTFSNKEPIIITAMFKDNTGFWIGFGKINENNVNLPNFNSELDRKNEVKKIDGINDEDSSSIKNVENFLQIMERNTNLIKKTIKTKSGGKL